VSAKDIGTGKEQKITIQGSSGLSKEEVERMTKEAEKNAAEDAKRKDSIETKNQLDSAVYSLEKTLKDAGDKLPAEMKSKVEAALADAKKALESNDLAAMKASMENLQKVGAEFYAQAQQAGAAPGAEAAGAAGAAGNTDAQGASEPKAKKAGDKGNVVDADFEVVDDDKKK